jgi:anthranilate phosphoribosyltransferase
VNTDNALDSTNKSATEEVLEQAGIMEDFPELKKASVKEMAIVLMFAAGVNRDAISEFCDVARSTVFETAKRYGVQRYMDKAVFIQRAVICNALGGMIVEALLRAQAMTTKMKLESPTELVNFAKTCADLYVKVQPRRKASSDRAQSLLDSLKGQS